MDIPTVYTYHIKLWLILIINKPTRGHLLRLPINNMKT